MRSQFFERLAEIKAVIGGDGTAGEKFSRIAPFLRDRDLEREFWNLLADEQWIPTLERAEVFKHPPAPESSDERTHYPWWGPSKYLARVAHRAPAEVAAILAAIETENVSVIGDLLDAAAAMPIDKASSLVPSVRRAAVAGILSVHFKSATELCLRLAHEGEVDLALSLAEALFEPTKAEAKRKATRSDDYWYKDGLSKVAPLLAKLRAHAFLPMLCTWLDESIRKTRRVDRASNDDYSYLWRPAIEEHEQNHGHDLAADVVASVRDGFQSAIQSGSVSLGEAADLLKAQPLIVFHRLLIHLVTEFGDRSRLLLRETILSRAGFDDYRLKHEYARLIGRRLSGLEARDQEEWYSWVDAGPDMKGFDDEVRQNLHREPSEADRLARIHYWQFQKLHWLHDSLGGQRRLFYDSMLAQHGVPALADLNIRTGAARWGDESPVSLEEFASMTFDEALERASSFKAADAFGSMFGGLVSVFGDYVSKSPDEYSQSAHALKGRPASVISAYLRQMSSAIRAGREIQLIAVLDLCRWVVSQPIEGGWQNTRDEISDLIETACKATREKQRPRFALEKFREPLWELVWTLCGDRSESYIVRDKSAEDPRTHDYLDLAINSPRGKAVEAGLEFARWVALHVTSHQQKSDSVTGGMVAVPELQAL